jgi:hypothetical protein
MAMAIENLQLQRSSKDEQFLDNVVGQTSSSDLVHGAGPGAGWLRPTRNHRRHHWAGDHDEGDRIRGLESDES